jgi:phosphate transport system permease protein
MAVTLLGAATGATLLVLLFIVVFVLQRGLPVVNWTFLFTAPREMGRAGGIFPMLKGTLLLPVTALALALPLGLGTAVYLTEYTLETRLTRVIRFGTDCLAGIPSILFGLFGFIFFVTALRLGWSLLSGALTLAIMILPTLIRTSEEAIRSVPNAYREVSFSLGATRWETVWKVVLPNALPGILTGVMLSIGRAVGETAAVIFTAGTAVKTMAVHFYILAREGLSLENAYGTAAVLILLILLINLSAYWMMHHYLARRA